MGVVVYGLYNGEDVSSQAKPPYSQFCRKKEVILPEYVYQVFNNAIEAWKDLNEKLKSGDVPITDKGEGHGLTLTRLLNMAIEIPLLEIEVIKPFYVQTTQAKEYAARLTPKEKELFNIIINHAYGNSANPLKRAFAQQIKPSLQIDPFAKKISTFIELTQKLDEIADSLMGEPKN